MLPQSSCRARRGDPPSATHPTPRLGGGQCPGWICRDSQGKEAFRLQLLCLLGTLEALLVKVLIKGVGEGI